MLSNCTLSCLCKNFPLVQSACTDGSKTNLEPTNDCISHTPHYIATAAATTKATIKRQTYSIIDSYDKARTDFALLEAQWPAQQASRNVMLEIKKEEALNTRYNA